MDAVRQIIDSNVLDGVIILPRLFKNKKVEIVVSLVEDDKAIPSLNIADIDALLVGSVSESLIGSIPHSPVSFDEYRAERLSKYECAD